jgi:hypothetical protein
MLSDTSTNSHINAFGAKATLVPTLLRTLALYAPRPCNEPSYAMYLYYRERILRRMLNERYELAIDVLELIAYDNDLVRRRALQFLCEWWPKSIGHLSVNTVASLEAKPLKPSPTSTFSTVHKASSKFNSLRSTPSIVIDDPKHSMSSLKHKEYGSPTLSRESSKKILEHVFYPHLFHSEATPLSTTMKRATLVQDAQKRRLYTGAWMKKPSSSVKCFYCHQAITGYGLCCYQCPNGSIHLQCLRKPNGRMTIERSRNKAVTQGYLFCPLPETQYIQAFESKHEESFVHQLKRVNCFALSICVVCNKPLLGISAQGMNLDALIQNNFNLKLHVNKIAIPFLQD